MRVPAFVRQHPLLTYFVLAFTIAWAGILWVVAPTGIPGTGSAYQQLGPVVFLVMLLGPSLAGLTLTAALEGRPGLRRLVAHERRWRVGLWYAAALITPLLLVALGGLALISPALTPAVLAAPDRATTILFALAIGLAAGFFEEVGWTGFALPRLQRRLGWLPAGVLLGLLWGLWHLLADYWGGGDAWDGLYAPRFLLWAVASFTAYRVLISWAYSHTGSLLLAQVMHAGFTGGQVLLGPDVPPTATGLAWYAAFAAALWLVVGAIVALERLRRGAPAPRPVYRLT